MTNANDTKPLNADQLRERLADLRRDRQLWAVARQDEASGIWVFSGVFESRVLATQACAPGETWFIAPLPINQLMKPGEWPALFVHLNTQVIK